MGACHRICPVLQIPITGRAATQQRQCSPTKLQPGVVVQQVTLMHTPVLLCMRVTCCTTWGALALLMCGHLAITEHEQTLPFVCKGKEESKDYGEGAYITMGLKESGQN